MWANSQPDGGIIFIGISDDGKIIGCKNNEQDHINAIEDISSTCPSAKMESKRVSVKNQKNEADYVIVIRVYYNEASA